MAPRRRNEHLDHLSSECTIPLSTGRYMLHSIGFGPITVCRQNGPSAAQLSSLPAYRQQLQHAAESLLYSPVCHHPQELWHHTDGMSIWTIYQVNVPFRYRLEDTCYIRSVLGQ